MVHAHRTFLLLVSRRQQRAAIFGEGAVARHGQLRIDPAPLPTGTQEHGDEARRLPDLRRFAQRHEPGGLEQPHRPHQPRALAQPRAGKAVLPACTDERLHHLGRGIVGKDDLRRHMVLTPGGDMDDLHRIGSRLRIEVERPTGAAGAAAERVIVRGERADRHAMKVAARFIKHAVDEQQLRTRKVEKVGLGRRDRRERRCRRQPAEIGPAPGLLSGRGQIKHGVAHAATSA